MAFLRARLDEQETDVRESRALVPSELHWAMPNWLDRDYVLADIAAKRRTIDLHAEPHECVTWDISGRWTCTGYFGGDDPCLTLRHLALSAAAHPDFDPTWAV